MTLPLDPALDTADQLFAGLRATLQAERASAGRGGLTLREVPAPRLLAPYAVAVGAEVLRGEHELAHGRLVVLHDPEGQDGWHGQTRVVAFVSAEIDPEMAQDTELPEVAWQWVTESLGTRRAAYRAAGGTVTRTVSRRVGELRSVAPTGADPTGADPTGPLETSAVEVRASWTAIADPAGRLHLGAHLQAWCDLLAATAGLPPPGVAGLAR